MLKPIIFWGGTGQTKVLREFVDRIGYTLVAVFDNDLKVPPPFSDVPLLHGRAAFFEWRARFGLGPIAGLAAIGGSNGRDRREVHRMFETHGIEVPVVVHPSASVAADSHLGKGTQVLAQSSVCAESRLGEACIVNTLAGVDHECLLGDGVHVGPGATLCGGVSVGDFTLIAAGAVVLPRIRIGRNVLVGAGAVVTKNVPDNVVVYGNPARVQSDRPQRE